jgi:hypothetical protein
LGILRDFLGDLKTPIRYDLDLSIGIGIRCWNDSLLANWKRRSCRIVIAEGPQGPQSQEGHDYRVATLICRRPLQDAERRDLIQRFTVPSALWFGASGVDAPNTNVVTWWGLPGGLVETSYSPDGFVGTNVTKPIHMFHGVVNRTAGNYHGQGYMYTHSFADRAWIMDGLNNLMGPIVFRAYDERARDYAQDHFEGC